jgi:hypothetical protein
MGYPSPPGLRTLSGFVEVHWLQSESIFGLILGHVAVTWFPFMMLGVGLDVLGLGRPVARWALRPLSSKADVDSLVTSHRLAPHLWALAAIFYAAIPGVPFHPDYTWTLQWLPPLLAGLFIYAVSLAMLHLWPRSGDAASAKRLRLLTGGLLLATALLLEAAMHLAAILIAVLFEGSSLDLPRLLTPVAWSLAFATATVLMTIVAGPRLRSGTALLPLALFFWLVGVELYSPSFAGFFAVLLLLLVMIEHCFLVARTEGSSFAPGPSFFLQRVFLPLCYGQARIMVRVAVLVALLGMLLPWTLHLVAILRY